MCIYPPSLSISPSLLKRKLQGLETHRDFFYFLLLTFSYCVLPQPSSRLPQSRQILERIPVFFWCFRFFFCSTNIYLLLDLPVRGWRGRRELRSATITTTPTLIRRTETRDDMRHESQASFLASFFHSTNDVYSPLAWDYVPVYYAITHGCHYVNT